MKLRLAIGACLPLALAACGSDDGPEQKEIQPIPAPVYEFTSGDLDRTEGLSAVFPAGIYQFQFTSDGQSNEEDVGVALISPSGRMTFATASNTPTQGAARIKADQNERFRADLIISDGGEDAELIIQGQRDKTTERASTSVNGTIEDSKSGELVDTFKITRDANTSDASIFLMDLAGTYRQVNDTGITTNLQITESGNLTGNDSTGCEFNGQLTIPEAGTNLVEAHYEARYCGSDGNLTGNDRDGEHFALGYAPDEYELTLFSASKTNFRHFTGTDLAAPIMTPETPEVIGFVSDNLNTNQQVVNVLNPGVYTYAPISGPAPVSPIFALLSTTGRLAMSTDNGGLFSHIRVSDTLTFTADTIDLLAGFSSEVESIFGVPEQGSEPFSIIGSMMDANGNLAERFRLTRMDAQSQGVLTSDTLARTYASLWSSEITTTFTIEPDGTLTGSDTTGCLFEGEAFLPDPSLNLVEARFTASGCTASEVATGEERNGDFNALGSMIDDKLSLHMTNGGYRFQFTENL